MAHLIYRLRLSRQRIACRNIEVCFPHLSPPQQQQLLFDHIQKVVLGFFETGIAWWWPINRFRNSMDFEGLEQLHNLQGKGALLLAGHFTSLEIGIAINFRLDVQAVYRKHNNAVYNYTQVRGRSRVMGGNILLDKRNLKGIVRALKQGQLIWYAADQDMGSHKSVFANFMGVPAATLTATAKIAKMAGVKVYPMTQWRTPEGRYKLTIDKPLENFPSGDDVADATLLNEVIASKIAREPATYLWLHRRFKTRPEGYPPIY